MSLTIRFAVVVCACCGSKTAYDERCQWCAKPLALQPRRPNIVERTRTNISPVHRRPGDPVDPFLRELERVRAKLSLPEGAFEDKLGYNGVFTELRNGRKLKDATRIRLEAIILTL